MQEVPIVFTTSPTAAQVAASGHGIVVTAPQHCFASGDGVDVENVRGNTAANGAARPIHVIDENSFELVGGIAGNNPWQDGLFARAATFGNKLPSPDPKKSAFTRVALVPNGGAPAQRIYFSLNRKLYRSDDAGFNFKSVATFPSEVLAIVSPANDRLWIGTRSRTSGKAQLPGEVHFSSDGGTKWRTANDGFDQTPGGRTSVSAIAVDPAVGSGMRVAVAYSGYSDTDPQFRTRHVYLTEDGGGTWREIGGTRLATSGNLPDLPALSLAFGPPAVAGGPSALFVAFDAGVLRWKESANSWERVGANLPNVSCQHVLADGATIRIGTYGRSAFELARSTNAKLVVRGNLGFAPTVVGASRRGAAVLHNAGDATLKVTALSLSGGDFSIAAPPDVPFDLAAGEARSIEVVFTPSVAGLRGDELDIQSSAGNFKLSARGDGVAAGGPVRVALTRSLPFGLTPAGTTLDLVARIDNVGFVPSQIGTITLDPAGSNAFSLQAPPALPLMLQPGTGADVTVRYAPPAAVTGAATSTLQVGVGPAATPSATLSCNLTGTASNNAADLLAVILNSLGLGGEPSLVS